MVQISHIITVMSLLDCIEFHGLVIIFLCYRSVFVHVYFEISSQYPYVCIDFCISKCLGDAVVRYRQPQGKLCGT